MNSQRMSVKVEVDPTEDVVSDIMDALEDALESIETWSKEDLLTQKFFTLRFDKTDRGSVAATVTATNKKGN